jgi:hypothetical protein
MAGLLGTGFELQRQNYVLLARISAVWNDDKPPGGTLSDCKRICCFPPQLTTEKSKVGPVHEHELILGAGRSAHLRIIGKICFVHSRRFGRHHFTPLELKIEGDRRNQGLPDYQPEHTIELSIDDSCLEHHVMMRISA